jgi:hypothetical protein
MRGDGVGMKVGDKDGVGPKGGGTKKYVGQRVDSIEFHGVFVK